VIRRIRRKLRAVGMHGLLVALRDRLSGGSLRLRSYGRCQGLLRSNVGLEVGGPSGIFDADGLLPAYALADRIDNCNFGGRTTWEGEISEGFTFCFNKRKAPGFQYIAEASDLGRIPSASYDFVLSSHCLEHIANPLKALAEWVRVLKVGGLLVLVVPHKEGTFDHRRPVTSLKHMIDDLDAQVDESDATHLDEILRMHDLARDCEAHDFDTFRQRSRQNEENRCLHHHVFDTRSAVEVVNHVGLQIVAVEVRRPFHIFVMAQKLEPGSEPQNGRFGGLPVSLVGAVFV
jgi:SAM-dependent methyltransferase